MKENNIKSEFDEILSFGDDNEKLSHDAMMLSLKFISEINELLQNQNKMPKKDLASLLDISPSFVSQLFNGDKKLNFDLLAKFQNILNAEFCITTEAKRSIEKTLTFEQAKELTFNDPDGGFWAFHNSKRYQEQKAQLDFEIEILAS